MAWIKRNLFFVIGSVVALVLMGMAGWYSYSKWNLNNEVLANLNADYQALRELNSKPILPGDKKIDNIKIAKDQKKEVEAVIQKARDYFRVIPRIPDEPKISDHDFSGALSRTIDQLQRDATNASVALPENYSFTFQAQKSKISFAAGSLDRLAAKLGEIKSICEILFQSKINSLENIRRERISSDDSTGPQTDYLNEKTVTNELAVVTPFELTFKCFSTELASVLSGFAASPNGLIVKSINVEAAPPTATADQPGAGPGFVPVQQIIPTRPIYPGAGGAGFSQGAEGAAAAAAFASRYGLRGARGGGGQSLGGIPLREPGTAPQTVYVAPQPVAATPGATPKGGMATVLDEKQLKVTVNLAIVRLIASKKAD